jgi:thioredoxin 1
LERLTDSTWQTEVLSARQPVAVVFWAEWCVPSRTAVETIETLAAGSRGPFRLGVVNVDENPRTTERYGIQGLPTLLVFRNGETIERRVGLMSPEDMRRTLARHV